MIKFNIVNHIVDKPDMAWKSSAKVVVAICKIQLIQRNTHLSMSLLYLDIIVSSIQERDVWMYFDTVTWVDVLSHLVPFDVSFMISSLDPLSNDISKL